MVDAVVLALIALGDLWLIGYLRRRRKRVERRERMTDSLRIHLWRSDQIALQGHAASTGYSDKSRFL
jgi:hypothetical protein